MNCNDNKNKVCSSFDKDITLQRSNKFENPWKYRKRMLICKDIFNINHISKSESKCLFQKYKNALFIRYTTDVDNTESTDWYCCIKDDKYDIDALKSKRKNVVRKGISNFSVREIRVSDYVDDFCTIINDAYNGYEITQQISYEQAALKAKSISEGKNYFVLGAFPNGSNCLVGYLWCHIDGNCISMSEQKVIREHEHDGVNAALLYALCEKYNQEFADSGYYLFDGWKNVLHNTNFQDYLIKYFGFRKAYSNLHIIYNPKYAWWFRLMLSAFPMYGWLLRRISLKAYKNIEAIKKIQDVARKI